MVGDGSYLMMNSETRHLGDARSQADGRAARQSRLRLHQPIAAGDRSESFNNLLQHTRHATLPDIDFAAHAASLGATSIKVGSIAELEAALEEPRAMRPRTTVIVIDTDPLDRDRCGRHWWDVAVPEVSRRGRR